MIASFKNTCDTMLDRIGHWMARRLHAPTPGYQPYALSDHDKLCQTLRIGDVVLVEGRQNVSVAIKYLTQSTWSHAALYVGNMASLSADDELPRLIEVELAEGCVAVPLSKCRDHNIRICRPRGLPRADRLAVARFMVERIGMRYDFRNILDLARYFLPTPPVPVRWRRRMLALGSATRPGRSVRRSLPEPFSLSAIRSFRTSCWLRAKPAARRSAKSSTSGTIPCLRPATSICRPSSRSLSRGWSPASILVRFLGAMRRRRCRRSQVS
jgi:hypothetical protein